MRTIEEHGAQHVHEIVMEDEAYNSVGEHLRNDDEQAKAVIAGSVVAGIWSVVLLLAILL